MVAQDQSPKDDAMPRTFTATYETPEAALNAYDDLIASGYPREKLHYEPGTPEMRVIAPVDTAPEAREILGRHRLASISEDEI